jgi:hypothetical protein
MTFCVGATHTSSGVGMRNERRTSTAARAFRSWIGSIKNIRCRGFPHSDVAWPAERDYQPDWYRGRAIEYLPRLRPRTGASTGARRPETAL